jgi:hypothetical protein
MAKITRITHTMPKTGRAPSGTCWRSMRHSKPSTHAMTRWQPGTGHSYTVTRPGLEAIFGRSYAAEPDALIAQLKQDEAIAAADTLLLTVPNQLGVDYNAHAIEAILKHVALGLGWR